MTTNTNRPAARFFASATPVPGTGAYSITDRTDGTAVALVKGRAAARSHAAMLTAINPGPRTEGNDAIADEAKAKRTSHATCAHASSKLARAICRREARKAANV